MNFLAKLKTGLSKSSGRLSDGITGIFTKTRLDDEALEALEELLIEADLGASLAAELTNALSSQRFDKEVSGEEVKEFLAGEIAKILAPHAAPLNPDRSLKPAVIMVVGVNGNGKTTTIGKLAHRFKGQGLSVMLAAADTFRAAAVEQLQVWGTRTAIPVITGAHESDPASVAFRAYEEAKAKGADVLLIDTAGRLQNKTNLMQELQKIYKVLKKIDANAPHYVIQILDATTGQNAISQVQTFKEMASVTGLIVTKLDGTARGGIVVALAKQFGLPIHAIGIGEGIDDLDAFQPTEFSRNLLGF
jgi:fused signal recognition particle receptor